VPPLVVKPKRIRIVCWILAVAVVVLFSAVATALTGPTGAGTASFRPADQFAMVGLGVLGAAGILAFTRPRLEADTHEVRIRNVIGGYRLPWNVVREVRFERGASWATLELADDDVVAVMAIQAVDKEYAVQAVRHLRALHAAATATPGDQAG